MSSKLKYFIQLVLKILILFLSIWFLYVQFNGKILENDFLIVIKRLILLQKFYYILTIVLFLMLINWGIEILKWKFLTGLFSKTSWGNCIKGVLSGTTISMFLPNRMGDFAAKILWLRKRYRWKGFYANIYASASQVLATILIASIAIFFNIQTFSKIKYIDFLTPLQLIIAVSLLLLSSIFLYFFFPKLVLLRRFSFLKRSASGFQQLLVFSEFSIVQLLKLLSLSVIRFIVYCLQFYLFLDVMTMPLNFIESFPYITLVYFFITIVPKFAIVEIASRGVISITILSFYFSNSRLVVHDLSALIFAVSTIIWFINLFIPALLGLFFLPSLNTFTRKD